MSTAFRTRVVIGAAFVAALGLIFYWFGRPLTAIVNGDVVLDYQAQLSVPQDLAQVDAKVQVWNGGFSQLEIMGLANPCPSCIEVERVPLTVPSLSSREIKIRLPLSHLPTDQSLPLEFRLLCNRPVANTAFTISLYRQPRPADDRVPTPARPKGSEPSVTLREPAASEAE